MDEGSLEIVNAGEMYPKESFVSDDGNIGIPFPLLSGENPLFRGRSAEGFMFITSYRLYHAEDTFINVPLGLIEYAECREIFYLYIYGKDGRSFRCVFENGEECQKWLKRIQNCAKLPEKIEECFAFRFLSWSREEEKDGMVSHTHCSLGALLHTKKCSSVDDTTAEAERMGFDLKTVWRVVGINENFKLCPSYPRHIIVPAIIQDVDLWDLAGYRTSSRVPSVVWRHQGNGCVIARSSQPRMGILSWRNLKDEKLIEGISSACSMDPGYRDQRDGFLRDIEGCEGEEQIRAPIQKKLLIIDARSYAAAMTNRAKGGGYECNGYYPNCEVQYMGLANIHAIRSSFAALRTLCSQPDDLNWLSSLENSKWLLHISGLLRSALVVVDAVDVEERPVLVHCSDGWDRTPQIVALAEIMLDPYYRTKKGFQVLVEREWLKFGHKFADRCGHPDGTDDRNERSPVFLQWLDCVYQLLHQFQCHFEFNEQYLARLVLHTYSCLFGTFLCNNEESRQAYSVPLRTYSVWPVLNEKSQFNNYLFNHSTEVLRPSFQIRSLEFWSDVYLPNSSFNFAKSTVPPLTIDGASCEESVEKTNLVKTKSCDNLHCSEHSQTLQRRKSDPSIVDNQSLYPQIPSLKENTPSSTNIDDSLIKFGDDESSLLLISTETNCNRTDRCEPTSSNLVLQEPTMLGSTDTLVSEIGALMQERSSSDNLNVNVSTESPGARCSVGTDTEDLPISVDDILQQVADNTNCVDTMGFPVWCENVVDLYTRNRANKSCNSCSSCSCATPNHSRTPSSGFPSTPCDEPTSSDLRTTCRLPDLTVMDFDGLAITTDFVQDRIKKLILHYKSKVGNLNMELSAAKCEFLQHMCRHYQTKELEDISIGSSGGEAPRESPAGSESSWDLLWASNEPSAPGI